MRTLGINTREDPLDPGFVGWATWPELRLSDYAPIPPVPGAYVVYRPKATFPTFVHPSPAGWFKSEDPTDLEARLRSEWVDGAPSSTSATPTFSVAG